MSISIDRDEIIDLLRESIVAVNREREVDQQVPVGEDTLIVTGGSTMDSLAFVTFTAEVESRLMERLGDAYPAIAGDLWADEDQLRDVRALAKRIAALLDGAR